MASDRTERTSFGPRSKLQSDPPEGSGAARRPLSLRQVQRLDVRLESAILLRALVGALKKLKEMGDAAYAVLMGGMRLAWAFSDAAVSWGNSSARQWRSDRGYAEYLGRFLVRRGWP